VESWTGPAENAGSPRGKQTESNCIRNPLQLEKFPAASVRETLSLRHGERNDALVPLQANENMQLKSWK
jgi:hypothetical protein